MAIVNAVRLQVYAARVSNSDNTVLQYNRDANRLREWKWPSTIQERVHPSELCNHRMSHQMVGPCCLCPLVDATGPDFVEAAIYVARTGSLAGEYVASCARGRCDYFVFMERLYNKNGLPIKKYPRREFGEQIPPRVRHTSEELQLGSSVIAGPSRPLKRTYAMLNVGADAVQIMNAPRRRKTISNLLARLDASVQPGILCDQFARLFARCECGLITTRRVFREHECRVKVNVIDLTTSDSDE